MAARAVNAPGSKAEAPSDRVADVLREAIWIVEDAGIPYVVIGGIASAEWSRPGKINDIDLFVKDDDADRVLERFADVGFETRRDEPSWLYKAFKSGVMVDIIFRVYQSIELEDEMLERATYREVEGTRLRLVAPEDLLLTLALSAKEETDYWYNALRVLASARLDWDYLTRRATMGPDRMLSLLLYARSDGVRVPRETIASLCGLVGRPETG